MYYMKKSHSFVISPTLHHLTKSILLTITHIFITSTTSKLNIQKKQSTPTANNIINMSQLLNDKAFSGAQTVLLVLKLDLLTVYRMYNLLQQCFLFVCSRRAPICLSIYPFSSFGELELSCVFLLTAGYIYVYSIVLKSFVSKSLVIKQFGPQRTQMMIQE